MATVCRLPMPATDPATVCPITCLLQVIKLPCPPPLAITAEEAQGVEVGGCVGWHSAWVGG